MWAMGLLIFGAMIAMVVGGFLLLFWIGKASGARGWKPWALGLAGLGLGVLAVIMTFYENIWAPPPRVVLELPAGYAHSNVILLEDPDAQLEIVWSGREAPFSGISTRFAVPANGVLRVKSLDRLYGRGNATIEWSDGTRTTGMGAAPAPEGTRARLMLYFERGNHDDPDRMPYDPVERGDYIMQRERLP